MKDHCQRVATDTLFAFVAILGLVAMFSALGILNDGLSMAWMVGSFGASITLLLACPESKLGRPYPALVGNTACAAVGVACYAVLGDQPALAAIVALTLAVFVMSLLRAHHPPAGATALLAVVGGPSIHALGWLYPLVPIFVGTSFLLILAHARQVLAQRLLQDAVILKATPALAAAPVPIPVEQDEPYPTYKPCHDYEPEPVNV